MGQVRLFSTFCLHRQRFWQAFAVSMPKHHLASISLAFFFKIGIDSITIVRHCSHIRIIGNWYEHWTVKYLSISSLRFCTKNCRIYFFVCSSIDDYVSRKIISTTIPHFRWSRPNSCLTHFLVRIKVLACLTMAYGQLIKKNKCKSIARKIDALKFLYLCLFFHFMF